MLNNINSNYQFSETSVTKPEEDAEGQSTATGIATDVIVNPLAVVLTIIPFLFNV